MASIADRLAQIDTRIAAAERQYGRAAGEVALLAVSKRQSAAAVREARAAGQRAFGENYVTEAVAKQQELADLDLEWHYIGPIQANKTKAIAESFDWVHSIDREKIARRLSEQRPQQLPPLQCCLQVNISGEASKSGAAPEEVATLAEQVATLPQLQLRGLMAIPAAHTEFSDQRAAFARLRELYQSLRANGLALDTLSMGMSGDLEAAIAEGATIVRIGTALFGPRD